MSARLAGKKALITAAGRGIGAYVRVSLVHLASGTKPPPAVNAPVKKYQYPKNRCDEFINLDNTLLYSDVNSWA